MKATLSYCHTSFSSKNAMASSALMMMAVAEFIARRTRGQKGKTAMWIRLPTTSERKPARYLQEQTADFFVDSAFKWANFMKR